MAIETLVEDVYSLFKDGVIDGDYSSFGEQSGNLLERVLLPRDDQRPGRVWFSNVGGPCVRKLWYKVNASDRAEPLLPHTRIKFLYGDLLEHLLLDLARKAGHNVQHEQVRVEQDGISGRIDAIIDNVLVDVKTASSYAFKKFESGLQSNEDSFGYLGQLGGYLRAIRENELFEGVERNRAAFFVINKETGKLILDVHEYTEDKLNAIGSLNAQNKNSAEGDQVPGRAFEGVEEGKSGNIKLDVHCSYCDFKHHCWPGLRTFLYSRGPVFLTHVEREPDVPELKNFNE